jgi:glyoxylase I family protein
MASRSSNYFHFQIPPRPSTPEATGLRHLAFEVGHLESVISLLESHHIYVEPIRTAEMTNKCFTFTADPDNLPIEFYER